MNYVLCTPFFFQLRELGYTAATTDEKVCRVTTNKKGLKIGKES